MKPITIRVPASVHEALKKLARDNRRSMAAQVAYLIEQAAKQKE